MEKHFLDDEELSTFVLRDIKEIHEPLISILKVMEVDELGEVTLLNLMTGFSETTTKEEMHSKYKILNGENLQKIFYFVYSTHDIIDDLTGEPNH